MHDKKLDLIGLLLDERLGDFAVMVYHDEDLADIRNDLREQGRLQGDDDELAAALWDYAAVRVGSEELI